ncbi:MAG: ATP-binding cassette domain-containing protein [Gemmatimonadota bacterium]|nr:ATP-binding cassette domain-containing protein [Gemmatimonadota bacterium]MYB07107.1 ATP-binding cassette domain-containing protein [Gemmatimonadota bacterium]MYG20931.1 ATP-binding cassette domain-containing protein [Gemmatimonadota bacterium]MYJ39234.1 ATP-binding cassette domain-containing protein [Gemmatimonadota bacterium]
MSIYLTEVHKAFGPKEVLKGFSMSIEDGETAAIVGPSGIGKSVLLKHVVGLLRPDAGSVVVDGVSVPELDRKGLDRLRRRIGYVFQFAALFDSMSIAENVGMGLRRIPGWDRRRIEDRVDDCLALVELAGMGDRYPAELSGGQRKRAGLARAIAPEPKFLLYDEPTTGLDPVTTSAIDRLILRMRDELGVTGLVVTHDMTSAFRVADRITLLHDGRARFSGTPAEVKAATDPVLKGFVEGDPDLYYRDGWRRGGMHAGGQDHGA